MKKENTFMKKGVKIRNCKLNDLNHQKNNAKFVTIILKFFLEKNLEIFSVNYLVDKWMTKTRQNSPKYIHVNFVTMNAANKVI